MKKKVIKSVLVLFLVAIALNSALTAQKPVDGGCKPHSGWKCTLNGVTYNNYEYYN